MELALTEEQRMIQQSAERFLAQTASSSAVRAAMASEPGHNPDTVGLCGTPRPQLRFVGAPRRGLARLAVGAAAWAGDENHFAPALVRAALRRVAAARAACADLFAR